MNATELCDNTDGSLPLSRSATALGTLTRENCLSRVLELMKCLPAYPKERFRGRGIVICAGGLRLLTNAWVCIRTLRSLDCRLPIEIWYLGPGEHDDGWASLAHSYDVRMIDAIEWSSTYPHRCLNGWELKAYAIIHCPFKEVILLDADNVPLIDPTCMFDWPEYAATGTLFWPDYCVMEESRPIWKDLGVLYRAEQEVESGQIVTDKERSWRGLLVANWINEHSDFFYQFIHGDKNAFQFGWYRAETPFAMTPHNIHSLEGTMGQHDFHGRLVFLHRNNLKWDLVHSPRVAGFINEDECYGFLDELREKWCVSRKFAGTLSEDDRNAMKEFAEGQYTYHRVGHDSRPMSFIHSGLVAEGAAECESYFYLRNDALVLLDSRGQVTCELKRQHDHSFYGRWRNFEKMPIVLEPVR